jgi:catechol 2,3-dioxygenase-like lactoylglutathione lyase family enzyme
MAAMKIEHAAWTVEDPVAAADWYVEHLGMTIIRQSDGPAHARFLADGSGRTLLEIYRNPKVDPPDYRNTDPLVIHLAFCVEDVAAERSRLLAAGATPVGEIVTTEAGDEHCMVRDPWGFPLQFMKRSEPMP